MLFWKETPVTRSESLANRMGYWLDGGPREGCIEGLMFLVLAYLQRNFQSEGLERENLVIINSPNAGPIYFLQSLWLPPTPLHTAGFG